MGSETRKPRCYVVRVVSHYNNQNNIYGVHSSLAGAREHVADILKDRRRHDVRVVQHCAYSSWRSAAKYEIEPCFECVDVYPNYEKRTEYERVSIHGYYLQQRRKTK